MRVRRLHHEILAIHLHAAPMQFVMNGMAELPARVSQTISEIPMLDVALSVSSILSVLQPKPASGIIASSLVLHTCVATMRNALFAITLLLGKLRAVYRLLLQLSPEFLE